MTGESPAMWKIARVSPVGSADAVAAGDPAVVAAGLGEADAAGEHATRAAASTAPSVTENPRTRFEAGEIVERSTPDGSISLPAPARRRARDAGDRRAVPVDVRLQFRDIDPGSCDQHGLIAASSIGATYMAAGAPQITDAR